MPQIGTGIRDCAISKNGAVLAQPMTMMTLLVDVLSNRHCMKLHRMCLHDHDQDQNRIYAASEALNPVLAVHVLLVLSKSSFLWLWGVTLLYSTMACMYQRMSRYALMQAWAGACT